MPALAARGVTFTHPGMDRPALDGVDLEVRAGECVALLGPNGAGKTTLIRTATGLSRPAAGSVRIVGGDPLRAEVRRRTGVMLQATAFPTHLTVRELVVGAALRAGRPRGDADRLLAELGLTELRNRRSHRLSGGQRRRVQLARALVVSPALLILDEPTEGLDTASRRVTWEHLAARRDEGMAILLTTHLVAEAGSVADRVAVITEGRIVANAAPTTLMDQLPDRTISVVTSLTQDRLEAIPAVVAATRETTEDPTIDRTTVVTRSPEDVLRWLLDADPAAHGLRVEGASLEDAVMFLGDHARDDAPPTQHHPQTQQSHNNHHQTDTRPHHQPHPQDDPQDQGKVRA